MKNLPFIPIKRPAFFMSVLVTCGIITAGYFSWVPPLVWLLTAWLSAICMMASIAAGRKLATTFLAASGSFCLGAGTAQVMTQTVSYHHVALEPPTDEIALIGRIVRDPETTDRGIRLTLSVRGVESGEGLLIQKCGLIRLFISDDEIPSRLASRLQYGAVIRAEVCLNPPGDYHNPGTFSQRRYLAIQDIHLTGTIRFTEFITVLSDPSPVRLDVMLHRLRSFLLKTLQERTETWGSEIARRWEVQPEHMKPLSRALLLGDRPGMDDGLELDYKNSGLYHLIAISGGHMVLIAAIFHFVFKFFRLSYRLNHLATSTALVLYGLLAGGGPTVNRAVAIIVLVLLGRTIDKEVDLLNILGLSAVVLLLLNPRNIYDVSFQLTYAATLGIIFFTPLFNGLMKWIPWSLIRTPLAVSLAAQLGTTPVSGYHFYMVPGWSFLPYLPVVPVMSTALASGIAGLLTAPVPIISSFFLTLHGTVLAIMTLMAKIFASWPGVVVKIIRPPMAVYFLFTGAVISLAAVRNNPILRVFPPVIMLTAVMLYLDPFWVQSGRHLDIYFIDTGNADCTLIRLPDGDNILVDGGGAFDSDFDMGRMVVAPVLRYLGVSRLSIAVVTHPHPDHQNGMISVLEEFPVRQLWIADAGMEDPVQKILLRTAAGRKCEIRSLDDQKIFGLLPVSINNRSLVFQFRYGRFRLLLPGDAECESEAALLRFASELRSDVLKAPHHGSRTSSTVDFLRVVKPEVIFIPCGRNNRFGHPHPSTLKRFRQLCPTSHVFRADLNGFVHLKTDGEKLWVSCSGDD